MRSFEEVKALPLRQWSPLEMCKAAMDWGYPEDEQSRMITLRDFLPGLEKTLEEETLAYSDMKRIDSRASYLKEWEEDLATMQDLIVRGIAFGETHNVWHSAGQTCSKCGNALSNFETAACARCRRSGFRV
jgi:hypothetical protein